MKSDFIALLLSDPSKAKQLNISFIAVRFGTDEWIESVAVG